MGRGVTNIWISYHWLGVLGVGCWVCWVCWVSISFSIINFSIIFIYNMKVNLDLREVHDKCRGDIQFPKNDLMLPKLASKISIKKKIIPIFKFCSHFISYIIFILPHGHKNMTNRPNHCLWNVGFKPTMVHFYISNFPYALILEWVVVIKIYCGFESGFDSWVSRDLIWVPGFVVRSGLGSYLPGLTIFLSYIFYMPSYVWNKMF